MARWTCPDCNSEYYYPDGARTLAITPEWDYCPKDGHLSERTRYVMRCKDCGHMWSKEGDWYNMITADSTCPECKGNVQSPKETEGVRTIEMETIETLITRP